MIFIPIPLPQQVIRTSFCTRLLYVYIYIYTYTHDCYTNYIGHGHGYEWHSQDLQYVWVKPSEIQIRSLWIDRAMRKPSAACTSAPGARLASKHGNYENHEQVHGSWLPWAGSGPVQIHIYIYIYMYTYVYIHIHTRARSRAPGCACACARGLLGGANCLRLLL